jgi:hypothetical protein
MVSSNKWYHVVVVILFFYYFISRMGVNSRIYLVQTYCLTAVNQQISRPYSQWVRERERQRETEEKHACMQEKFIKFHQDGQNVLLSIFNPGCTSNLKPYTTLPDKFFLLEKSFSSAVMWEIFAMKRLLFCEWQMSHWRQQLWMGCQVLLSLTLVSCPFGGVMTEVTCQSGCRGWPSCLPWLRCWCHCQEKY